MAHSDRLTALDAGFLHLERGGAHMHVASILVFVGDPPGYDELVGALDARLHLVPRYRQKLAHVPLGQGRPVWIDDPHFNVRYHVRHSALPEPGSDEQLKRLAARQFARPLDRTKPLWELSLVEGLEGATRFAIVAKTHHALVDGVSGVDVTSVLFDTAPDPTPPAREPRRWVPRPEPPDAELLAQALLERATVPAEAARNLRALTRAPRRALAEAGERLVGLGAMAWAGMRPAPPTPFNVPIGPHRRYTWVDADLPRFKAIKDALGGTLNDAVLAAVALALGRFLRRRGEATDGVVLKAMVPVSVRADAERGALGNRVAAMWAPLPVAERDPQAVFAEVSDAMRGLKESGQAVGAVALTSLADFAPPTILSQAARLQARQRLFNLVVTNVPGPQVPLYLLGRRLERFYPVVPLARNQALGIAIMSYDGRLGFGLLGDYDAMPDLEALAHDLERAIADLERAAGVAGRGSTRAPGRSSTRPRRAPAGGR
jgi:WS/DGAT/MGAT family acyltransferase